jgi:lysozyme
MSKLIEQLKRHEGFKSKPYLCTAGKTTIGFGLNLDAGISEGLAEVILERQVYGIKHKLVNSLSWFCGLNDARKDVVINMVFNVGYDGFMQFKKTIAYLSDGYFEAAATEMMDSKWAKQVGNRAVELAEQMRSGKYA